MVGEMAVVIHGLSKRPDTVHDIIIRNCDFGESAEVDLLDCRDVHIL